MGDLVFKTHIFTSFFMTGLIWLIQIVHYPLMSKVGGMSFVQYHSLHSKYISFIVMPIMLLELASFALIYLGEVPFKRIDLMAIGIPLGVIWLTTAFLSVPAHNILANGFNETAFNKLVNTNWLRTIAWSFKSLYLLRFIKIL